jgi:hypothetical protein
MRRIPKTTVMACIVLYIRPEYNCGRNSTEAKSFNYLLSGTRTVFFLRCFLQLSTISTYDVLAQQSHIISHNIESL